MATRRRTPVERCRDKDWAFASTPGGVESIEGSHAALETLKRERAKKKNGEPSELMDLLIAYDWNENFHLGLGGAAGANEGST